MPYFAPLSGSELDAIRQRLRGWQEGGFILPNNLPAELRADVMIHVASEVLKHAPADLQRCLAEIDRRAAENDALREGVAKIVLTAEDSPDPDGMTYHVRFTKDLLDQLRTLALSLA